MNNKPRKSPILWKYRKQSSTGQVEEISVTLSELRSLIQSGDVTGSTLICSKKTNNIWASADSVFRSAFERELSAKQRASEKLNHILQLDAEGRDSEA